MVRSPDCVRGAPGATANHSQRQVEFDAGSGSTIALDEISASHRYRIAQEAETYAARPAQAPLIHIAGRVADRQFWLKIAANAGRMPNLAGDISVSMGK